MNRPQRYFSEVQSIDKVSNHTYKLNLHLINPSIIDFEAGQFINIKVSETSYRSYSIATGCDYKSDIGLYISTTSGGVGSNYISKLRVNSTVEFIGPAGVFTLPENLGDELVFVCTSTGIAPFLSMFKKLTALSYNKEVLILFGVREFQDLFALKEIDDFGKGLSNFTCIKCISKEQVEGSGYYYGRVTDMLKGMEIRKDINQQFFICGNPNMIIDSIDILTKRGVFPAQIFHEKFSIQS